MARKKKTAKRAPGAGHEMVKKNIAKHKKQQKRKVGTSLRNMTMSTEALRKHLKVKRTPNNNLSTRGANMNHPWITIHDIQGFHIDTPILDRDPVEIENMDDFINFSRHPSYTGIR
eukprot:SAG22_NODE_424_length_10663_cov_93.402026_11_plen_116_part_00